MRRLPLALIASAAFGLASAQVSAATALDTNVAEPPGVYFGTGNVNGHFTVGTGTIGGVAVELGLRAGLRFLGPVTPVGGTNIYDVPTGTSSPATPCVGGCAAWNFEFSVHTFGGLVGDIPTLTLSWTDSVGGVGHAASFDPRSLGADNAIYAPVGGTESGIQNSQNLQFYVPYGLIFDHDQQETYTFTLSASDGNNNTVSDTIIVQAPEPASMALLGLGLAGLAGLRRRR